MNSDSPNAPDERNAYLEEIFASAVDAIVVIDERGIVQDVNPALHRLFGYETNEVLGHNVSMLMPSPDREQHDQRIRNYLDTSKPKIIGIGREVVGRRKDGSTFPMHLAVSEIHSGSRRLFVGVVRDITDLKAAENQLRVLNDQLEDRVRERTEKLRATQSELVRSEKLATLGQVSGSIAHEIRNPLNVVKTSAYFLCHAKSPTPEKIKEHLTRIDRQVNMIDSVVTALSDVARLPDPVLVECIPHQMIQKVARTVELEPSIQIENQLSEDLPRVSVDENQILIVFRNLIRNARDAMPAGGKITVDGEVQGDQVLVHVRDEGTGIPREDMTKIMEPLYSTKATGMGLGLAISIAIAQKNRGTITVQSTVGKGSTFSVVLPSSNPADAPDH